MYSIGPLETVRWDGEADRPLVSCCGENKMPSKLCLWFALNCPQRLFPRGPSGRRRSLSDLGISFLPSITSRYDDFPVRAVWLNNLEANVWKLSPRLSNLTYCRCEVVMYHQLFVPLVITGLHPLWRGNARCKRQKCNDENLR